MSSARAESLAAAAVIAAAAGLLLAAMQYPLDSRIFPMMVLGAMLMAGILWLIRSLASAGRGTDDKPDAAISNRRQLLGAAAVTAAYGLAVSFSSYFIPTVIFIPLMAYVLGNRNLPVTVATGAGFSGMAYLIFVWLFERPVPLI